ncbi:MAG: polymer-forming cytoskeletal protein [Pseudomonadota bacterium]|nr:polymer-forming cytoskeletal protein [Pseudomonadota bacterium]
MADRDSTTHTELSATIPRRPPRAADELNSPRPVEIKRPTHAPHTISNTSNLASPESKKLIVGSEIHLTGNISACDRLIIEGRVEADLEDCREIEIAATGTFKGSAAVELAEVSGHFDGALTARELLIVRSTGRVTGTVRYAKLEIERGGEIIGDLNLFDKLALDQ